MKNIKHYFLFTLIVMSLFLIGCKAAENTNSTANKSNAIEPSSSTNSNTNTISTPEKTEVKSDTGAIGSLATPTDAYKTAYELRKKKDIEGLKKVMTNDILEFLTMMGDEEKKSLDDILKELAEKPLAAKPEVRNEKISGDTATIEYLDADGKWKTMDFEKVGNDWKLGIAKGPMKDEAPKKKK